MYQLFSSLAYIHQLGICHRDIKPQNLLLDPETAVLKLCDFGSAKMLDSIFNLDQKTQSFAYTPLFSAPEVFQNKFYNYKVDIYVNLINIYLINFVLINGYYATEYQNHFDKILE